MEVVGICSCACAGGAAVGWWWRRGKQSCCLPKPTAAEEDTQYRHWEVRPIPLWAEDVVEAGSTSRLSKGLGRIINTWEGE